MINKIEKLVKETFGLIKYDCNNEKHWVLFGVDENKKVSNKKNIYLTILITNRIIEIEESGYYGEIKTHPIPIDFVVKLNDILKEGENGIDN